MPSSKPNLPAVAGTKQTDIRYVKRSSGVNVLPSVVEAWAKVRDDSNPEVDWILIGYDGTSKTDITLIEKGKGGMDVLSAKLSMVVSSAGGVVLVCAKPRTDIRSVAPSTW